MKLIQLHQEEKQLIMLAVENNRQAQQQIYAKFNTNYECNAVRLIV